MCTQTHTTRCSLAIAAEATRRRAPPTSLTLARPPLRLPHGVVPPSGRAVLELGLVLELLECLPSAGITTTTTLRAELLTTTLSLTHLPRTGRVVQQAPSERNFHIFYAMCAGATAEQRAEWCLRPAESYTYLSHEDRAAPGVDEKASP